MKDPIGYELVVIYKWYQPSIRIIIFNLIIIFSSPKISIIMIIIIYLGKTENAKDTSYLSPFKTMVHLFFRC